MTVKRLLVQREAANFAAARGERSDQELLGTMYRGPIYGGRSVRGVRFGCQLSQKVVMVRT